MQKADRSVAYATLVATATVALASAVASAVPVIDGTRDAEYGAARAVQTIGTQFGNSINGNPVQAIGGSELDAGYATVSNGRLHLFFAGNLESTFNKLEIFVDSIAGGQNQLRGDNADVDFNGLNRIGADGTNPGLRFDGGFAADYYLTVTNGNNPVEYFANYAELLTDGRGNGSFIGTSGPLDPATATNALLNGTGFGSGITIGANNSNVGGVAGLGEANTSDPASVTTGFEISIPLSLLGNAGGPIRVIAAVNGGGHDFLSNQFLGALPDATGNLGEPRLVDLAALAGDQFFTAADAAPRVRFTPASGNYSNAANFSTGTVVDGETQILAVGADGSQAINLDQPATLNYLEFDGGAVTVSGTGPLAIAGPSRRAFRVTAGTHTISAPVNVNKSAAYEVATGASLTLTNFNNAANTAEFAGNFVDKVGGGTLSVPAVRGPSIDVAGQGLDVRAGTVRLTSASVVSNVNLLSVNTGAPMTADGATLDLTNAAIVVNYTLDEAGNGNPLGGLRGAIVDGNILSSTRNAANQAVGYLDTAALPAVTSFNGVPLDATALVFRATLRGDANLDLTVGFPDLVTLAQNYNGGEGKQWYQGDFNYDGIVAFADLVSLAQNYNTTLSVPGASAEFNADWALAQSLVPEPTSLAALALAGGMIGRRRR